MKTLNDTDSQLAACGLRSAASDARSFNDTLGKDDPQTTRDFRAELANNYDRIANDLEG